MKGLSIGYRILIISLLAISGIASCTPQPQKVRRLSDKQEPDSALIRLMTFNMQMASAADKVCREWVENDSATYILDDFGFWYSKTTQMHSDSLQPGEQVSLHIQLKELNGSLLGDLKEIFTIGSGDLPIAINRSLKQMSRGEQMRIVAPWHTAYGTEGTSIIKPYTNLIITLSVENE